MQQDRLRINEIFYSLQGESTFVGERTVFIRLTGCPLRCQYCDTSYAFSGGEYYTADEILENIAAYEAEYVTVTGGEPLAQKSCLPLLSKLCDAGYRVSLETSGALSLENIDPRVVKIMDIKTPDSQECEKMHWQNLDWITGKDQIKFVICSYQDFNWALQTIKKFQLKNKCQILFSPSYQQVSLHDLAQWILTDKAPGRLQIQLHKFIWGEKAGC